MKLDLKLYRGYVNDEELVVFGHLFESWAPDKYSIDRKGIKHAYSILNKFRIKPLENFEIRLKFRDLDVTTKTQEDGYFRFTVPYDTELEPGWHTYEVSCKMYDFGMIEKGELLHHRGSRNCHPSVVSENSSRQETPGYNQFSGVARRDPLNETCRTKLFGKASSKYNHLHDISLARLS